MTRSIDHNSAKLVHLSMQFATLLEFKSYTITSIDVENLFDKN